MTASTKELTSEFIGTYILVLTVGCNVLGGSGTWAALSIAASLMTMVYALGSASGAAFNPAVIFAVNLNAGDKADWPKCASYMLTQIVAGIAAAFTYKAVHGEAFNLEPGTGFSYGGAATVEILYTLMLCFVVLRTAVEDKNEFFGLAIGFVIVAGGYAGGWISKGAFNPAVAIGLDLASHGEGVFWCLPYTVFELIGAAVAVAINKQVSKDGVIQQNSTTFFISEFLGTFFLVFTVGLNVIGGSPAAALSIAASLMCMIYALGGVSGAHFNPAVTTSLVLAGKFPAAGRSNTDIALYMGAQLLGGLVAGFSYVGLTGKAVPLAPGGTNTWAAVGFAEIIYTFVLCFVVLNVAASDEKQGQAGKLSQFYGLAIGFCIVVGGFAIGGISGGSLNPAVSFGLDTSNAMKGGSWINCLTYSSFEFMGGALAAGAYSFTKPSQVTKQA